MQNKEENCEETICGIHDIHGFLACMNHCIDCAKKCMEEGERKLAALCSECADMCSLALKSKHYQSEFQHQIACLCARICQKCAKECQKFEAAHCRQCAEVCTSCSESCSTLNNQ